MTPLHPSLGNKSETPSQSAAGAGGRGEEKKELQNKIIANFVLIMLLFDYLKAENGEVQ